MNLITCKMKAKTTAQLWKEQYREEIHLEDGARYEIYLNLLKLGENPMPEQVNDIIGNTSWTAIYCMYCKKSVEQAIVFYDGEYLNHICKTCLYKWLKLFKGRKDD